MTAPATPATPADTETTGLTDGEQAFVRKHAAAWARTDAQRERATAYAAWYFDQFVPAAQTMNDLPAHHHVWGQFLDHETAWKRTLCDAAVTLNGEPAKITGVKNEFAYVRIIKSGLGCEWAWEIAGRIVAAGGDFRS
jgi:hypothetical protein